MSPRNCHFVMFTLVLLLGIVSFSSSHEMGLGEKCTRGDETHFCNSTANLECCACSCSCKVGYKEQEGICVEGADDNNVCATKPNDCSGASTVVITTGQIVMIVSTGIFALRNMLS
ncbi:hypothetical protein Ocin01_17854 [Orchesella cincta]|uniref:TNFR-Cys domain-containing protein n=1 Tax=Orchesella cincta TaxID=48709 RepID=A0A1D2M791_ORCCI|nr:hypothetical protein Ocin01_17854 [Orchesella cincta]